MKQLSIKKILFVLIALSPLLATGVVAAQSAGWSIGDSYTRVYTDPGSDDLNIYSVNDLNLTAQHIRMVGNDGNFEFENGNGISRFNSYVRGTATRTPIIIGGGDSQNVVGLILDSGSTQTADILQIRKNGATGQLLAAISANGDLRSTSTLNISAPTGINLTANHLKLVGNDGNLELQSTSGSTRLNSYVAGTTTRNPIIIGGGDSQNVTGLVIDSSSTQTADILQLDKNGTVITAFDSQGRLRLNGIAVELKVINGNLEWVATMPDGTLRYLRFSKQP
jgi:hypothetical protein